MLSSSEPGSLFKTIVMKDWPARLSGMAKKDILLILNMPKSQEDFLVDPIPKYVSPPVYSVDHLMGKTKAPGVSAQGP